MNKLILIILSVCILSFSSNAQTGEFSFGVSAGFSFPTGDWAGKEIVQGKGWAGYGVEYNLNTSYQFANSPFGITAMYRNQTNVYDDNAQAFALRLQDEEDESYSVRSEAWRMKQFLVGGSTSFPFLDVLSFDLRAMVGVVNATRPIITVYDNDNNWNSEIESTSIDFAYQFGASLKLEISKNLDLVGNLDYFGSRAEFEVEQISNAGRAGHLTVSQNIASVNISGGFAIKF